MNLLVAEIKKYIENTDTDKSLLPAENEEIKNYINRIFNDKNNYLFINDIMNVTYHWLDSVKCPFKNWKEDVHYYNLLEEAFDLPQKDGIDNRLKHKVIHHIQKNITHSINVNRTVKELYAGWDDE